MALWEKVARDYDLSDPGSVEQLAQACSSLDRAEAIREQIDAEGACVEGRAHPLLRAELDHRSFLVRTLQRLGLES